MNGDRIPDIVAPPSRLGESKLHVWIGDGKGHFSPWPLNFIEGGKPNPTFSLDYGAVAVGDIDGDGHADVAAASHGAGLVSLFGDGKGTFRVGRRGLPTRDFSSQAIVLADADGDGRLDIIAATDSGGPTDTHQVRVYLYRGADAWQYEPDSFVGLYSNSLSAWDFDGDRRSDILSGSHFMGATTLLWKNLGNGRFDPVRFPEIEIYAYHFASVPGTFGRGRVPAFADAYYMMTNAPEVARATGITLYSFGRATGSGGRNRAGVLSTRSRRGTSTVMAWTTSSSPTAKSIACASSSRSRRAPSGRWTKTRNRSSTRWASASGSQTSTATAGSTLSCRRPWPPTV